MPHFEVNTYKVSSIRQSFSSSDIRSTRVLETFAPDGRILPVSAIFYFSDAFLPSTPVGYLTERPFRDRYMVGWFPASDFDCMYDIVRSERPVFVRYEYEGRRRTTGSGTLVELGLGTELEPVGEGPSESLEVLERSLIERLEARDQVDEHPEDVAFPPSKQEGLE
jgi:hypothetical protein